MVIGKNAFCARFWKEKISHKQKKHSKMSAFVLYVKKLNATYASTAFLLFDFFSVSN